jgi:hypothetical protein
MGNLAIFGLLLVVVEGLASYALVVRFIKMTNNIVERRHTKYDPDLGWVNEPNIDIPDMYGPGIYLRTNSQGFRNNHDISPAVPAGKARIICSGDSFTLGYGVDNDQAWCNLLSLLDSRLETVNMGQGGYGVDQAYLWYKRDSVNIEHQVHLFAFITSDFGRMQSDSFRGYAKPVLDTVNNTLVVKNAPVPKRDYYFPSIMQYYYKDSLSFLRTVDVLTKVMRKIGLAGAESRNTTQRKRAERDEHTRKILREVIEDLKDINEQHSSKLVLIYLPDMDTLAGETPNEWTEFLEGESRSLGVPLINLVSEFGALPYREVVPLFISQKQIARGHLSVAGNNLVSKLIHNKLMKEPTISRALGARLR